MHVFEMVVLVVGIGVIGGIITKYLERGKGSSEELDELIEEKMHQMGIDPRHGSKFDQLLNSMKMMEERIQVLERIATDKGVALKDEINRL